jgi:hypothetical protein
MRLDRSLVLALALLAPLTACDLASITGVDPGAPTALTYQLLPSGNPSAPAGVILTWSAPVNGATSYDVYGRTSQGSWELRATTTSTSFHDLYPEYQYYVVANDADGHALGQSSTITIDLQSELPAPAGVSSTSLNGAIQLMWSSNASEADRNAFDHYRVYSAAFDNLRSTCSAWNLEGSTVSDAFLVANLQNGITRCYAVSAVSHDGHESNWSPAIQDTPRYDAHNVLVYSHDTRPDSSGFAFYDEGTKQYGIVSAATHAGIDFTVERHADGTLWLNPASANVTIANYGTAPAPDLTSIDKAPVSRLANVAIEAVPGYGYVFGTRKSDGLHYAAVRIAFVAQDYIVFDWAYQSAVGNIELSRAGFGGVGTR